MSVLSFIWFQNEPFLLFRDHPQQLVHRLVGPELRILLDEGLARRDNLLAVAAALAPAAPEVLHFFRGHSHSEKLGSVAVFPTIVASEENVMPVDTFVENTWYVAGRSQEFAVDDPAGRVIAGRP